jgi:2-keto-4-pentenoate hydratase/2-oxohepta-3-ene-1,7-dioic acid hydratase in catechol pathway
LKLIRYADEQGGVHYAEEQAGGGAMRIDGDIYGEFDVTTEPAAIARRLAPVQPAAILGMGLNYRQHAAESGMPVPGWPVVFVKTNNSLQHPDAPIVIPRHLPSEKVDYECELAVVIGRTCRNVSRDEALDYVLGYTCANDVSARDWQLENGSGQWCRGKMFDTFAPLGPCLVTADELPDPHGLRMRTLLNGEVMQDWRTDDMIFDVPDIIAFLSGSTTLLPGTVILTGTPQGVGMARKPPRWLREGDTVVVEIEGIGRLSNPVVNEMCEGGAP